MSSSFSRIDRLDISDQMDFLSELLNSPASSENCILVAGPDLVKQEVANDRESAQTYMGQILEGMLEWCVQNKVIQQPNVINDLRTLLYNGAFVPLGYKLEEHLASRQQKQDCLRAVLYPHNQVKEIHRYLTRIPFRSYIITSYDTCIETAYAETWHSKLSKFYPSSLARAVIASRKKQPFILKLYGDLDRPDSIKLGHRLLTGLYAENAREQLRQLFSEKPVIFIGFNDADQDIVVLQSFAKDGCIVHQKHPTHVAEEVQYKDFIEISGYTESEPETLSRNEMLLALRTSPHSIIATRQRVSPTSSTPLATEQDSQETTQQRNKKVIDVIIFYAAPEDKRYKDGIVKVLNGLKIKEGKPYEIKYMPQAMGESIGYKTDRSDPLLSKQLVILLISLPFLGSDHYKPEHMRKVVNRHLQGAWICPILVSPCDWRGTQFDSLEEYILPTDKVPISDYRSRAKAYLDISKGLEYALDSLACC